MDENVGGKSSSTVVFAPVGAVRRLVLASGGRYKRTRATGIKRAPPVELTLPFH